MIEQPPVDEIILYTSVADYEARLAFVGELTVAAEDIDKIVGKYELPKDRDNWSICGLNGCREAHRFGYIIRTLHGTETNCGNVCGRRKFGVKFEEVEARAQQAEETQARRRVIADLLRRQPEFEQTHSQLLPMVRTRESKLDELVRDFGNRRSFWSALQKVYRVGGIVRAEADKGRGSWSSSGSSRNLETIGIVDGMPALFGRREGTSETLINIVGPWIQDSLSESNLAALDQKQLQAFVKESESMEGMLKGGAQFVNHVDRLMQPKTFELFDAMCMRQVCNNGGDGWGNLIRKWISKTQSQ